MLHIFTYGAGNISRFEFLKTSADSCSLSINYISQSVWSGFFDKVKFTLNAIKNLPDDDIVCFVDGFDVLAISDSSEILSKFLSYNCDILFGAELNCWPGDYINRYPKVSYTTQYKYLNSGGFCGYKHAVMDLYTWKSLEEIAHICKTCGGDQGYFIEYYLANFSKKNMKLDSYVKIFQNMFSVDWKELYISNGRVLNSETKTNPCFLHFNGDSWKTNKKDDIMPLIIERLNISRDTSDKLWTFTEFTQNFNDFYFKRRQI